MTRPLISRFRVGSRWAELTVNIDLLASGQIAQPQIEWWPDEPLIATEADVRATIEAPERFVEAVATALGVPIVTPDAITNELRVIHPTPTSEAEFIQ